MKIISLEELNYLLGSKYFSISFLEVDLDIKDICQELLDYKIDPNLESQIKNHVRDNEGYFKVKLIIYHKIRDYLSVFGFKESLDQIIKIHNLKLFK